jgi:hypothetical protein
VSRQRVYDWIVAYVIPHWLWLKWRHAGHPVSTYYRWRKWRAFPVVGERITYHDEPHTVIALDDADPESVQIDTGEWVSWMHCCGSLR